MKLLKHTIFNTHIYTCIYIEYTGNTSTNSAEKICSIMHQSFVTIPPPHSPGAGQGLARQMCHVFTIALSPQGGGSALKQTW